MPQVTNHSNAYNTLAMAGHRTGKSSRSKKKDDQMLSEMLTGAGSALKRKLSGRSSSRYAAHRIDKYLSNPSDKNAHQALGASAAALGNFLGSMTDTKRKK